jgi:hypothetical protein
VIFRLACLLSSPYFSSSGKLHLRRRGVFQNKCPIWTEESFKQYYARIVVFVVESSISKCEVAAPDSMKTLQRFNADCRALI